MTDSDFTIGFKQGQEHGIQIMQEKIEEIKQEIRSNAFYENPRLNRVIREADVLEIIDKHLQKGE